MFSNKKFNRFIVAGFLGLILLVLASISFGSSETSFQEVWDYIFHHTNATVGNILWYVRIPRTIATILCGSALAVAGLLFQSALNNALASAGTIGVNSGAGLFVVLGAILFPGVFVAKSIFAFAGSLLAAILIFFIARKNVSKSTIVMAGVAISSLLTAFSDTLITLYPDTVMDKSTFFIGGFAHVQSVSLPFIGFVVIVCLIASCVLATRMNVLMLGDEMANSLGLPVVRTRYILIFIGAILAACSVSIGGILSFVGLLVPHMMRSLLGNDHRYLLPATLLVGAILVLGCDLLARLIFAPFEIPVGIILSFLGSPFFLWLILSRRKRLQV